LGETVTADFAAEKHHFTIAYSVHDVGMHAQISQIPLREESGQHLGRFSNFSNTPI